MLEELGRRGHNIVPEPGRRIVQHELADGGSALPWRDREAFARRAFDLSLQDLAACSGHQGWTFFDRGLIDAATALEAYDGGAALSALAKSHRFHRKVFLAPPWPEIFRVDHERRHDFEEATREYGRLRQVYTELEYGVVTLPKMSVAERADFILLALAAQAAPAP